MRGVVHGAGALLRLPRRQRPEGRDPTDGRRVRGPSVRRGGHALPRPNPEKFGVAELDGQGHIVSLVEKPKAPKSDLALVGIYLLRTSIFPIIKAQKPSWRNELEITEALDELRKQGGRIRAAIVKGWWKDTGKPEDILEANHLLLDDVERRIDGTVEEGAAVEGRVRIGEGTV